PSPTSTASPTSGGPLSLAALKLQVLSAVGGRLSYCDPDEFPVGHGNAVENARARLPIIQADRPVYLAILAHEHIAPGSRLTTEELVAINDDYKQIQAFPLQPAGAVYRFTVNVPAGSGSSYPIQQVSGTVDRHGHVRIEHRGPGQRPACPIR